jgi:hypothetical protein
VSKHTSHSLAYGTVPCVMFASPTGRLSLWPSRVMNEILVPRTPSVINQPNLLLCISVVAMSKLSWIIY